MASSVLNTVTAQIENSSSSGGIISGMGISRTVKNQSGVDIAALKPIVNAGWDNTDDCMIIRPTSDLNDIIIGITLEGIDNGRTKVIKYVATGLISGIDTSMWNKDDFLYATTDGYLSNNPEEENTIAQEIAVVLRSHATKGEIWVSTMANQVKFLRLAIATVAAMDASAGSVASGESMNIRAGAGDGSGSGGDIIAKPGKGGASGTDGMFIIPQAGTVKSANKYLAFWHDGVNALFKTFAGIFHFWNKIAVKASTDTDNTKQTEMGHDGTDGFIEPKSGMLKTNNKDFSVGSGKVVSNKMADSTDATKIIQFVYNQATGTTKTLTIPDANVDLTNIHSHANKAKLDVIDQNLSTTSNVAFKKVSVGDAFMQNIDMYTDGFGSGNAFRIFGYVLQFNVSGSTKIYVYTNGYVGINNGVSVPTSPLTVNGDIESLGDANGLVLNSATKRWRIKVSDAGTMSITQI